jgi:hypothetical protein
MVNKHILTIGSKDKNMYKMMNAEILRKKETPHT